MKRILQLGIIILCIAFLYLGYSYVEVSSSGDVNLENTFIPSANALSKQNSQTLNLTAPYLQSANIQKSTNEFDESTIDSNGFYLRIDKIDLFKAIVEDVDPRYEDEYRKSWEKGISHGKFTAKPNQIGITYLFSHAVSDERKIESQNAWFTRLDELSDGDKVIIYYKGNKYTYQVNEIHVVDPSATGFYTGASPVAKIRMQYCGPPTGSLSSRTLVDALLVNTEPI